MADQELYEKIEAYLNGDLKGADLVEFEQKMQSEEGLAAQVAMFRDMDSAISDKPVLNFQKLVEDQGSKYLDVKNNSETRIKRLNWRRNISIAAGFLLLATALFLWNSELNSNLSNQQLFAKHFETYNLNQDLRSGKDDENNFNQAIQKYQAEAYNESTDLFQLLVEADNSEMTYAFGLAQSALNQEPKNLNLAKLEFEKIVKEGNSIYVPASKWYLSLIALAQDDQSTAQELLTQLESGGGNWSIKAKQLNAQLKD